MRSIVLGIMVLLLAVSARAEWLEASSDHFIIYSEQDETVVKRFSERLERFHGAMAFLFGKQDVKPSPSNRVTVFVVSSGSKVRKITGATNPYTVGQYIPRAGMSVAVIPNLRHGSRSVVTGETILYHEYAHHFMIAGLSSRTYPRWFNEGFAEFFSGVRFKEDGSVALGAPAHHRAAELTYAQAVPIRKFLDFDGGAVENKRSYDSFYGQSWLLFHYLQMAPERKGQLAEYQRKLAAGHSALQAADSVFGDLDVLERELDRYMRQRTLTALVVQADAVKINPIVVRKLRPGESAMMPIMIESKVGVTEEEARELVSKARKIAQNHLGDAAVLSALSEAEFDAGNLDAAVAAADAAIALDPNNINAHLQKGYALSSKVQSGALSKESWKDVRAQFIKANRVENDHPIPLVWFYLSYLKAGEQPTKNAISGLEWALQLAPFDTSLRWLVAEQMIADERYKQAAQTLAPLAYSPHPSEETEKARQLLQEIEGKLQSVE